MRFSWVGYFRVRNNVHARAEQSCLKTNESLRDPHGRRHPRLRADRVTGNQAMSSRIRLVNLEEGFPNRDQAYQKLEAALTKARKDGIAALKVIHGYGSSGAGGVLRFAIRGYLRQRKEKGEITAFVNGESWSSFDERSKQIFAKVPESVLDADVGRGNKGITLVLL
jgi:Smr domain